MLWPVVERSPRERVATAPTSETASAAAPTSETASAAAPPAPTPAWLRPDVIAPYLAAELGMALGIRRDLLPLSGGAGAEQAGGLLHIITARVAGGLVQVAMPRGQMMAAISVVLGDAGPWDSEGGAAADMLRLLAPDNASWAALAALMARALKRALASAGAQPLGVEALARPEPQAGDGTWLALAMAGDGPDWTLWLGYVANAARPAAGGRTQGAETPGAETLGADTVATEILAAETLAAGPDAAGAAAADRASFAGARPADGPAPNRRTIDGGWAQRVESLSLLIEVPVTLRLSSQRLPLARVMRLSVGDVLALPPVRTLGLMVAGEEQARIPLSMLGEGTAE